MLKPKPDMHQPAYSMCVCVCVCDVCDECVLLFKSFVTKGLKL